MVGQSQAPEDSAGSGFSLGWAWRAVRKSWLIVMLCGIATGSVAAFYILGEPKIYRATATVKIEPSPALPMGPEMQSDLGAQYLVASQYYETQYWLLKSKRVAEETVRRLGLQRDPTFAAFKKVGQPAQPLAEPLPLETAAAILRGRVSLDPRRESQLVGVSYEDADRVRAQRVVSTLVSVYVEQNLETALLSTNSKGDWLNDQLEKLKKELEASELGLHKYKTDKRLLSVSLADQTNMLRQEIMQLNERLTALKVQREELQARYDQLAKVAPDDPSSFPASELLDSPTLGARRDAYFEAKATAEALAGNGKGENHPEVMAARARFESAREALLAEVANIKEAALRDVQAVDQQLVGLSGLNEHAKQLALDLNANEMEYGRLERTKGNTEKLYSMVLERAKESDLAGQMRFNNVQVVDDAELPGGPVRPRVPFTIVLGAMGGLALGIALALGRDLLDTSVKTPEALEKDVGVSFLGLLPRVAEDAASKGPTYGRRRRNRDSSADTGIGGSVEVFAHRHPASAFSEAIRGVRTNLQFMSPDQPYRRLLVTSAGPAEGKTTVACSLAIALAQAGKRVILVDCDLRRPRLHKVFAADNSFGVSTAVIAPEKLDEVSLATEIPNLSVMPSGPKAPSPAELLQSESFRKLLDRLSERYDQVVLDSPPVMPVTDARILATMVDGTVLVVKAFTTSRHLSMHAVRGLRDVGAVMAGGILNSVNLQKHKYGYYEYYYQRRDEAPLEPAGQGA